MPDLGLGLASGFGAGAGADALQELIKQRLLQAQFEEQQRQARAQEGLQTEHLGLTRRAQDLAEQQHALQLKQRDDTLAETRRRDDAAAENKRANNTRAELTQLGPDDEVSAETQARALKYAPISAELMRPKNMDQVAASQGAPAFLQQGGERVGANAPPPMRFTFLGTAAQREKRLADQLASRKQDAAEQNQADRLELQRMIQEMTDRVRSGELDVKEAMARIAQQNADTAARRAEDAGKRGVKLDQAQNRARLAIEEAGPLTDTVMQMIRKSAPDIETNPEKYNTVPSKLKALVELGKYKLGFMDESDPRIQLVSLLQPVQAGQYLTGSRSQQMLKVALAHMADPSQTLLTQYQRAKELKALMPEMLKGVIRSAAPVDPDNPLAGSYFDPNRSAGPSGEADFDFVGGRLVPRKR